MFNPSLIAKVAVLSLLSSLFVGCRAHMMETHGDSVSIFAIGKEKPARGGVIRYLNTGATSWRSARRKDAEKQMRQFCKGGYTIKEEGPRSKFGSSMPIGKSVAFEVDEYWYVSFECASSSQS
jgi:hypothetical protein